MADSDNELDNDNDDLENTDDEFGFLDDNLDADSQLDELTFGDDDFVDPISAVNSSIDDLLTSPLDSDNPAFEADAFEDDLVDPTPAPTPTPLPSDQDLLDDDLGEREYEGAPLTSRPRATPIDSKRSILDKAFSGSTATPSPPAEPTIKPEELGSGNMRLDHSQRRRRPLPPTSTPADADEIVFEEDDIVFEDNEEVVFDDEPTFIATPATEIPVLAESTLEPAFEVEPTYEPEPEPEPEPTPLEEPLPELEPSFEPLADADDQQAYETGTDFADEVEFDPSPDPIPIPIPIPAPELDSFTDDDFEDLPDVPELELPPIPPSPTTSAVIDPRPIPDLAAISELPSDSVEFDAEDAASDETLGNRELVDDLPPPAIPTQSNSPLGSVKRWVSQLKPLELASLVAIFLSCLVGIFLFTSWSKAGLPERTIQPKPSSTVPTSIEGKIANISRLEAYWRPVSASDSDKITSKFLPVLDLTLSSGQSGYLLAIFRDAEGKLVGTADQKVENGKFVTTGLDSGTLTSLVGLENEFVLSTYQVEDEWQWSVSLRESSDKDKWTELANFYFPGDSR